MAVTKLKKMADYEKYVKWDGINLKKCFEYLRMQH